jgi:peptidase E
MAKYILFSALDLIPFDIYPHYNEKEHQSIVGEYEERTGRNVKRLKDKDLLILD